MPDTPVPPAADELALPDLLKDQLNGHLAGEPVIAWSRFDLDAENRLADSFAVLTPTRLIHVARGESVDMPVDAVKTAKVYEGVGMDRLVVDDGEQNLQLRYSRKHRKPAVALHRQLKRLIPGDDKPEDVPTWLKAAEQTAAQQELCPKCGEALPTDADKACPKCAQGRTILWRLLDVAKPLTKSGYGNYLVELLRHR